MTFELNTIYQGDNIRTMRTFPANSFDLIFCDPPYNMRLNGDLYRPDQSFVDAVNDEWDVFQSPQEYDQFTRNWLKECRRVLKDDGTIWVIGSYHNIYRVGTILMDMGFWILNDIVWIKDAPMPNFGGTRFQNAHETLLWCKKSETQKRYTFNYEAMKMAHDGTQERSDWYLPLARGKERIKGSDGKKLHSTQKPEALLYRVLLSSSNPGDVILDPFFGSGTTGAVAKMLGRQWVGIEQDETYVKGAQERIDAIQGPLNEASLSVMRSAKKSAPKVPFVTLLEQGYLRVGDTLYFNKKIGSDTEAVVCADGSLYLPLSNQQGSIHKMGAFVQKTAACNGWDCWWYLPDTSDTMILIDDFRDLIRKGKLNVEL